MPEADLQSRLERLSDAQRECLRRVHLHQTSKEIALALGVSSHTIDERVRRAIRVLGVPDRISAARLLCAYEAALPQSPSEPALEAGQPDAPPGTSAGPSPSSTKKHFTSRAVIVGAAVAAVLTLALGIAALTLWADREPTSVRYYPDCAAAERDGRTPLHAAQDRFAEHLDGDGDGVACE
jgi:DNA-binding CsgD family transcriptional regulator